MYNFLREAIKEYEILTLFKKGGEGQHCCQPFNLTTMKSNLFAICTEIKVTKDVRIYFKNIYEIDIASCNSISILVSFVFHIAGHCH